MWFGTDIGLNRYDGKSIKIYKHDPDDSNSISHDQIQAIYQDRDEIIWICTYGGGLNKYNPATDKFTHFKHDPNDKRSISNDFLLSICGGKSGDLWIGTNGTGIEKYNNLSIIVQLKSDLFTTLELNSKMGLKHNINIISRE